MIENEVKVTTLIEDRPSIIPLECWIFNAEQRLWGTIEWTGALRHGRYYAAIDPEDKHVKDMVKCAIECDAYLCTYVSMNEVKDWFDQWAKNSGIPESQLTMYTEEAVKGMYYDQHPPTIGELPQPITNNDPGLKRLKQYLREIGATLLSAHHFRELGVMVTTYTINEKSLVIQTTDQTWSVLLPIGGVSNVEYTLASVRSYCQTSSASSAQTDSPCADGLRQAFENMRDPKPSN